MSVQVPRSMMGAIPDAHGIVTDHDGLAIKLANLFVVITRPANIFLQRICLRCSRALALLPIQKSPRK